MGTSACNSQACIDALGPVHWAPQCQRRWDAWQAQVGAELSPAKLRRRGAIDSRNFGRKDWVQHLRAVMTCGAASRLFLGVPGARSFLGDAHYTGVPESIWRRLLPWRRRSKTDRLTSGLSSFLLGSWCCRLQLCEPGTVKVRKIKGKRTFFMVNSK
eukprot:6211384-Pleurochrysis_carterae.AAC.1